MDCLSPLKRLLLVPGLESVKKQFEKYRAAYKQYAENKEPDSFSQNMILMGNPGSGKTTAAKLFAEILDEDGLLPKSLFVEVSLITLISPYIGQTSLNTRAICEKAKGGVLFIDDIEGGSVFHQEAFEGLLKFMIHNDDTLVILAGHPEAINELLNNSNLGIRRHFNELGIFEFEDC